MLNPLAVALAAITLAAAFFASSTLQAVLLVLNFLLQTVLLVSQWLASRLPRFFPSTLDHISEHTFVSIHVPAHNEPPDVLKQTLKSLAELDWPNYEVLLIDNNTPDESVWRPVQEYCEDLGPKFRFFHVENMKGFKAGAMNWVRKFMDPRTEVILVVDADYQLAPDAIRRGLKYFVNRGVALVQFPQDYRNSTAGNVGITLDFKHFFSSYMNMANRLQCVPSTGTLSFVSARALRKVGGFDEEVVTEDAELGLRFNLQGLKTVYVHESIGHGLMPFDLESLKKQRWRWAFGNAQILKRNLLTLLASSKLSTKQKLGCLSHLTAWFNFNLLPVFSLLFFSAVALAGELTPIQHYLVVLSGFSLVSYALMKTGVFILTLTQDKHSIGDILKGSLTHLSLEMIFALSWVKCLFNDKAPFIRTNKFVPKQVPGLLKDTLVEAILGVCLLVSGTILLASGFVIAPAAAFIMSAIRFSIFWVDAQLRGVAPALCEELPVVASCLPDELAEDAA